MRIIGLDLSLTRTGYVLPDGTTSVIVPPKGAERGMPRLRWIRDSILSRARMSRVDLVVIEGYAMGMGREAHNHAMGELGGVVRLSLFEAGISFVDVPPAVLKKYATGKGNANKELVLVEAVKRLGFQGSDNNEADALWLWHMAHDRFDGVRSYVPATNREALGKVEWPAQFLEYQKGAAAYG